MDVVATRSQLQISMQLPGKAFRIVRFNVRQEIKFVKVKSRHFRRWTRLCWTFRLSDAIYIVWTSFGEFVLDNSLVFRDSWGILRYPSRNRACGVEKFSTPSVSGLSARALAEEFRWWKLRNCLVSFLLPSQQSGWWKRSSICIAVEIKEFAVKGNRHQNISVFLT